MEDKTEAHWPWWGTALLGAGAVVGTRAALPHVVKKMVNDTLATAKGVRGEVGDISFDLLGGSVILRNFWIGGPEADSWRIAGPYLRIVLNRVALLRGELVGEAHFHRPQVSFTVDEPAKSAAPSAAPSHPSETLAPPAPGTSPPVKGLPAALSKLPGFHITGLTIVGGTLNITTFANGRPQPLSLEAVQLHVDNFATRPGLATYATLDAIAEPYGQARMHLHLGLDTTRWPLTGEARLRLEDLDLRHLNPLLSKMVRMDLGHGKLSAVAALNAGEGRIKGFVTPSLSEIVIGDAATRAEKPAARLAWESLLSGASKLLENPNSERIASEIPIDGVLDDPHIEVWPALMALLSNAFVRSLTPSFLST